MDNECSDTDRRDGVGDGGGGGKSWSVPYYCKAYRALFKAHLDEEIVSQIRSATNGNYALGSERFQKEIEIALGRRARRGYAGRPANDINPDGTQGQLKL